MIGRPGEGQRRRFKDEITYYYRGRIKVYLKGIGSGGYRFVDGFAPQLPQKGGKIVHGDVVHKTACREDAAKQSKRAVFVGSSLDPGRPFRDTPKTLLEQAESRLSAEQLQALNEIWTKIQEQKLQAFRAVAFIAAENSFHAEAVEAVKAFYSALSGTDEAQAPLRKRILAVGAAMAWLRLKAGGAA
jgi:hypothetical protein